MVFIIIAIDNDLENLKPFLISLGYSVVNIETYKYPVSAILYKGTSFNNSLITENNIPQQSSNERIDFGVLMVNVDDKNAEKIDEILKTRCYSSIL